MQHKHAGIISAVEAVAPRSSGEAVQVRGPQVAADAAERRENPEIGFLASGRVGLGHRQRDHVCPKIGKLSSVCEFWGIKLVEHPLGFLVVRHVALCADTS